RNNGAGGLLPAVVLDTDSAVGVNVARYDADAFPDVIVLNGSGVVTALFGDGAGGFPRRNDGLLTNGGDRGECTPANLDGDLDLDLVCVTSLSNVVSVFRNDGTGS